MSENATSVAVDIEAQSMTRASAILPIDYCMRLSECALYSAFYRFLIQSAKFVIDICFKVPSIFWIEHWTAGLFSLR